jgi:hypothetical protein
MPWCITVRQSLFQFRRVAVVSPAPRPTFTVKIVAPDIGLHAGWKICPPHPGCRHSDALGAQITRGSLRITSTIPVAAGLGLAPFQ